MPSTTTNSVASRSRSVWWDQPR